MSVPPLIVHIVFRLDYGGLENGLVNLVNRMPRGEFRHAVIALTEITPFSSRLNAIVPVYAIGKRPGKDLAAYWRLYRLLRKLRPAAVHTRNIGTLDCVFVAALAGVRVRLHGEHGWDTHDPDGTNRKYRLLRRVAAPFVWQFVTVSEDLKRWLTSTVGICAHKVVAICNGVDTQRFRPPETRVRASPFDVVFDASSVVIGSVTRFAPIKDPLNLIDAFLEASERCERRGIPTRLAMVGDGALRPEALEKLSRRGALDNTWLPGERDDIPELLRAMDVFVLGSLREGISNTILEAMASGLPVVATATGGNPELVVVGVTGALVPTHDSQALAAAIEQYACDAGLRARHGRGARERVEAKFSISSMVASYVQLYRAALARGAHDNCAVTRARQGIDRTRIKP